MKKPTASDEWNFLIIMVPPMLNAHSMRPDHAAAKPSGKRRDPNTSTPKVDNTIVNARIEYLYEKIHNDGRHRRRRHGERKKRTRSSPQFSAIPVGRAARTRETSQERTTIPQLVFEKTLHRGTLLNTLCSVITPFPIHPSSTLY